MTERKCLNLIKKDWEIMSSNPDLMEKAKSWYPTEHEIMIKTNIDIKRISNIIDCYNYLYI